MKAKNGIMVLVALALVYLFAHVMVLLSITEALEVTEQECTIEGCAEIVSIPFVGLERIHYCPEFDLIWNAFIEGWQIPRAVHRDRISLYYQKVLD